MIFSKNSQLVLRHQKFFQNKKIFFSGNIEDDLPINLLSIKNKIHLQKNQQFIYSKKKKNIYFYHQLLVSKNVVKKYNTLIYYWPKNKSEAKFQLLNILSCFPIGSTIFVVGGNSSGVKSAKSILKEYVELNKIDNANHSILMSGILVKQAKFILENFFKTHIWKNLIIKSLPGVFGYKKIDEGSKLLASTFSKEMNGEILDVGCGSGFLSASLLRKSPQCILTMIDRKNSALVSSQATLNSNFFIGTVLSSDIYSNVFKKFNIIISNPPFHNDLKTDFDITKKIIIDSKKYLKKKGELRFVTNRCFSYDFILKKVFSNFFIIKKNKKYKIYQCFLK